MRKLCILLLIMFFTVSCFSQQFDWNIYTSLFRINDLCYTNSKVWCATEGGLLAYDINNQKVETWTLQNGLASNLVTSVISDSDNILWLGFDNGLIQIFDLQSSEFSTIFDYRENKITCLKSAGDSLFVGLDIGVSLYIKSRREVKETYKHLGYDIQVDLPVKDIEIVEHTIWAATEEGLAYSQLNNTNLLDPANWTNVFAEDGLPSSMITSLLNYNNTIYVGTDKLLAREAGDSWENIPADTYFKSSGILDMATHGSELYILSGNGVYQLKNDILQRIAEGFSNGTSLTCTDMAVWTGTERGLKYISENEQNWNMYIPDTPQSNIFKDLTMDKKSNLWCAVTGGFCSFNGEKWSVYDKTNIPGLLSEDMRAVTVDNFNNIWVGSWGGGIILITPDSTFQFFNANNDYLGGVSEDNEYAVVPDMMVDHNGAVWILNYRSDKKSYLISVVKDSTTGDFIWTYYATQDSLLSCITEDSYGRKWIGTENNGVFVLDDNNTPTIKNDDYFAGTLKKADGLESEEITSLAADESGGVWIGTTVGLYYYFNSLTPNYQIPSQYVQSLLLDGFDNLWVGMDQGLSFFPSDSYFGENYNAENSLLTSNNVQSFTLDNTTGNLYIGTDRGLTCIQTPYAEPELNLNNVIMYPNPFKVGEHTSVTIDNLAQNTAVYIYSPSGYLVRSFTQNEIDGKMIKWDGTNKAGDYVASGVYIVVAAIQEGETNVGKLAVIH